MVILWNILDIILADIVTAGNTYKLISVRKQDWHLLGFTWMDKFFIKLALVIGPRSSSNLFNSLHELLIRT